MTAVRTLRIDIDQTGDAGKGIKGIAGSLGKLTSVVGIAAAGIGALTGITIGLGAKLLGLGSDAAEMGSKFNVVFGESAPRVVAELDKFGDAVGRSKFELMEMASLTQDTFVPMGFARDKAADLSVSLVKLAVDVASFDNKLDTEVMADFQSAMIGNHETVRKYGIIITQVTLGQELMNMGVAGGVKEATEAEKVQARLNIIYAGTTDAQGDAAATAGGWANQMRALGATVSEAATAMGSELLPVVLPLLQNFVIWVKDIMPKAVEVFKEFAAKLGDTVGPAILMINDAVKRIAEAFGVNTEEVSSGSVVLDAFATALDVIVIAIQATAIVMQGLASAIEWISKAVKDAARAWDNFRFSVKRAADSVPDWMTPGSPTPFEMGLRGIGSAISDIGQDFTRFDVLGTMQRAQGARDRKREEGGEQRLAGLRSIPSEAGGRAGGRRTINVTVNYAPAVSLGTKYEAEEVLAPMITNTLRAQGIC